MLTMHQVLMAENPKVTPAELESSIAELFEALLKILDGSPNAGTDEIVEAMIRASASAGSPPSEEKIQARRQMLARASPAEWSSRRSPGPSTAPSAASSWEAAASRGQKLADAAPRRRGQARRQGGEGRRGADQGGHGVREGPWSVVHSWVKDGCPCIKIW